MAKTIQLALSIMLLSSSIILAVSGQVEVEVGALPTLQHGVSGTLFLVGTKSLKIRDFYYDGQGPDVFLYYYPPGITPDPNGNGQVIRLSEGMEQFDDMRFTGQELLVNLTGGVSACNIGHLTIWCRAFKVFFTRIEIPRSLFENEGSGECILKASSTVTTTFPTHEPTVETAAATEPPTEPLVFENCEELDFGTQVRWTVDRVNEEIIMQLRGCEAADRSFTDYLAFGLSGSSNSVLMFGADPVVAWVDDEGPHAVDYYLSGYFQCRGGMGACPDVLDKSGTCTDDVTLLGGMRDNGVQWISFKRPFLSNDSRCDRPLNVTNSETYTVWGVGPLGQTAFKHTRRANPGDPPLHFGRTPLDNCRRDVQCSRICSPFTSKRITALEDSTFLAQIGPSALERGYTGITGRPAWGIAWFINGTLIPELEVQRGRTYTFIVEGGNDTHNIANYHPLYITDSIKGGRTLNTKEQQMEERIFAGFDANGDPTGAGRFCNLEETDESNRLRQVCSTTLEEYIMSLTLVCEEGRVAMVRWTPDENTPDLVYYQCAVHLNLGWKIHVRSPPAVPTTLSVMETDTTKEADDTTTSPDEVENPQTTEQDEVSETSMPAVTSIATPTQPSCPVPCTYNYCTARETRRNLCSNPNPATTSNCSSCHITYCKACYNSEEKITKNPGNCIPCKASEVAKQRKCFRKWATCVRRAHSAEYNKVNVKRRSQNNFACYNPICVQ